MILGISIIFYRKKNVIVKSVRKVIGFVMKMKNIEKKRGVCSPLKRLEGTTINPYPFLP